MLIINNEQAFNYHCIIKYLPKRLRKYISCVNLSEVEEIRLRRGQPLTICGLGGHFFISERGTVSKIISNAVLITDDDINDAISLLSQSSLYAVEESLKNGYITVGGGNRVGICGHAEIIDGKIKSISKFSGLNYRLAREIVGIGNDLARKVENGGNLLNTLIISPPGCGKTTLLRDTIRELSNKGYKVSVVDERNEISALHNGYAGFDLGFSSDVIEGVGKEEGFLLMLRSMSPDIIATDEIGCNTDYDTVIKAKKFGVCVIATAHAKSADDIRQTNELFYNAFDCVVTLGRSRGVGTVEDICFLNNTKEPICND